MRNTTKSLFATAAVAALVMMGIGAAWANLTFRHTITGEELDFDYAPEEGRETAAVEHFLKTGKNLYNEVPECFPKGEEVYLVACSGCHGHYGEGKVGVGINDDYWTYPKNTTDKGLFETIFGGAQGMMGPHGGHLTMDELLLSMAWIRHLYTGDPAGAEWLTEEQRSAFKPFDPKNSKHSGNLSEEEKAKYEASVCTISPS